MTRTGKRLIQDFIIPALESQKYGDLLHWTDRNQKIFQLKWSHKNAARWSSEDTNVFQDWDRLKGHYYPDKEGYFMQAKQRFRAALQKLKNYVKRLENDDKGFKRYKLLNPEKKIKNEKEKKKQVRKIVRAIPTSVIRQNLSYNGTMASSSSSVSSCFPSSPSSPSFSQESNHSIMSNESSELEILEQAYKSAQERQMRSYEMDVCAKDEVSSDETLSDEEVSDSDQKENLLNQPQAEPAHAPIESRCNMIPIYENFATPRFESPKILLVKTHYESWPRPMGNYNVGCVMYDSPSALNLSVKQEVK